MILPGWPCAAMTLMKALVMCQRHKRRGPVKPQRRLGGSCITGRDLAARVPVFAASGTPLGYVWPPGHSAEPYLGAAHGLTGILYALLLLQQHAPQCMPNPQQDLADMRAALRCVHARTSVLYYRACGAVLTSVTSPLPVLTPPPNRCSCKPGVRKHCSLCVVTNVQRNVHLVMRCIVSV